MSEISVPVSFGELLDKIAILEIKAERIRDEAKLANVRRELEALQATWAAHPASRVDIAGLRAALKAVNERLWVIEDDIRLKEKAQAFDAEFVRLARAVYFGANVLILDEPTSALGVRQSGIVLKYILSARERGVAVIFITHNPHHAFLVGDHFYLLNRGRMTASFVREKVQLDELIQAMAGGAELDTLTHEISVIRQD